MSTLTTYQNKPFDPTLEMGVMIRPDQIRAYAKAHGHAALGQLMADIEEACRTQDGEKALTFPIVESVTTRPAGSESTPY